MRYQSTHNERDRETGYDFRNARSSAADVVRFGCVDPLEGKYPNISPYAYCSNNPISIMDINGKEWDYFVDADGHTTISVTINLSVQGNYTTEQIAAYKNSIATQFNDAISDASGGTMSGSVIFYDENPDIIQTLTLGEMDAGIAGTTSYFYSSVNLFNSQGELKSLSDIGIDATHEILHTLRLEHPFEVTQTEDTKLLRDAPNSFVSTSTTNSNIVNNIMNYSMISIDGQKSNNLTSLTKGQLVFMLNEVNLQKQGYGFKPKYNHTLTPEQNGNIYNEYYENYWLNVPGTPVGNK